MSRRPIPKETVARSLAETVRFANTFLPILKLACEHVKIEVGEMPDGGARHRAAEKQLAPSLVRLRVHQLIQGHNLRCLKTQKPGLQTHHMRNGAVCLLQQGVDYRLLKASSRYPTRPSGHFQEALINQDRYYGLVKSGQDYLDGLAPEREPLLSGLIYYEYVEFELLGAYVVIPNGFHKNRVVVADSQPLELYNLEDLARFESTGVLNVAAAESSLILSEPPLDADLVADPYAESELVEQDLSENLESGQPSQSVLSEEESERSDD